MELSVTFTMPIK
ncbi:hypothetical protein CP061683_0052A, partial [Chlamydia psittaci 06-1683]